MLSDLQSKPIRLRAWCLCLLLLLSPAIAQDLATLQDVVRQWIALEKTHADEAAAWEEEKALLAAEQKLAQAEFTRLDTLIADTKTGFQSNETLAVELNQARQENAALATALEPELRAAEANLIAWTERLPESLRPAYAPTAARLDPPASTAAERLQHVLAAMAELEGLQNRVHTARIEIDGKLADVIFLGLAQGFAVTPNDSTAARATYDPDVQTWNWQWNPAWATDIRRAVRLVAGDETARLTPLPVQAP